jgi:hypothetical protein
MGLRVLSLLLLVLAWASAAAPPEAKRILLLGSYRSALPANRVFAARIREELDLPPRHTGRNRH